MKPDLYIFEEGYPRMVTIRVIQPVFKPVSEKWFEPVNVTADEITIPSKLFDKCLEDIGLPFSMAGDKDVAEHFPQICDWFIKHNKVQAEYVEFTEVINTPEKG